MAGEKRTEPDGPLGRQPSSLVPSEWASGTKGIPGFLLTDLNFKPFYLNSAAVHILSFPGESQVPGSVQERIRSIFEAEHCAAEWPPPTTFLSGKRRYVCRPFHLELRDAKLQQPTVALLLERQFRDPIEMFEARRRFRLSPRECETVQHLIHGLTTKEVAQRMKISPNTVKQYIRLVMSKVGVTTRSGIIGKILSA